MLKTLLVPIDGSPLATRAIPYATALARAAQARIVLLRAVDALRADRETDTELAARAQLDADAGKAREQGVEVESYLHHLHIEDVGEAIVETATKREVDLIVMSTHGRSGIGRFIYGSVADKVLRTATLPVLLVPANCERAWPTVRPPRILVPLDRSELGTAALGPAVELAKQFGGELILAHVVPLPSYAYGEGYVYSAYEYDLEAEVADATTELEAMAEAPRAAGTTVRIKVTTGFPLAEVATIAREEGADLVAMATHGRGGLARLVLGSVATATLQRAGLPVFLVRPVGIPHEEEQPAEDATGPDPVAARLEPPGPTLAVTLSRSEIDLIERGLGDLLYLPESDPRLAKPVKALLARFKEAEGELAAAHRSAATAAR